jgi:FixJ family two-component response regulator
MTTPSFKPFVRHFTFREEFDMTPTVFVVDDDVSMREAIESLVLHAGWQPATFDSAHAFLAHPRVDAPKCLVLDITLPGLNGLDLQKVIAVDQLSMPIIFITAHGDVPTSVQAMKAGAFEFLTKPIRSEVLLDAMRNAIGRSQEALFDEAEMRSLRKRYALLTAREREVMALIVTGLLNKEVGSELGISIITVKVHRAKVMQKMEAESFAELLNMEAKLRRAVA